MRRVLQLLYTTNIPGGRKTWRHMQYGHVGASLQGATCMTTTNLLCMHDQFKIPQLQAWHMLPHIQRNQSWHLKNWQSSNCQDMGSKISHLKEYDGTNILLRNTSDLEIGCKTSGKEPQNEELLFIHSYHFFGWWGLPLHSVKSMYVCTWDELSRFCGGRILHLEFLMTAIG